LSIHGTLLAGSAGTPSTEVWMSEERVEDWSLAERMRAAQDPMTPPDVLERLAVDGEPDVRQAVALNPGAPSRALASLAWDTGMTESERRAQDVQRQVREFAVVHPNLPTAVLEQLAEDPDFKILQIVARQPHTPPGALERLAASTDITVRLAVASHPRVPGAVLERLAGDEHPWVREKAAARSERR
jgi:hypothetical protein